MASVDSLEAITALGYAVATAFILLPFTHVGFHHCGIQLLVLHGKAGIGLRVRRSVGIEMLLLICLLL